MIWLSPDPRACAQVSYARLRMCMNTNTIMFIQIMLLHLQICEYGVALQVHLSA